MKESAYNNREIQNILNVVKVALTPDPSPSGRGETKVNGE